MRNYHGNAVAGLLVALLCAAIFFGIVKYHPGVYVKLAASICFSVLIPAAFLLVRSQTRQERIHAAEVFRRTFDGSLSSSVYFEFFERKYYPGIGAPNPAGTDNRTKGAYPFPDISSWLLLGASFPFIVITAAGVFILVLPVEDLSKLMADSLGAKPEAAWPSALKDYGNALTIASLAFASAYLYSLRLLFKSLVAYEAFAIAFLRAFAHILFTVLLAVMLWRVAPEARPFAEAAAKVQNSIVSGDKVTVRAAPEGPRENSQLSEKPEPMPKIWLALALIIGFVPDYAFSWMLHPTRLLISRRYRRAARHSAVAPLTVIDGIDFAKSYRLGEANIADVQNLSIANPIMLHVETSYCMFLIIDWIAQAQLCAAVGGERFLLFKKINIRTIFDLERAVLDPSSPAGLKQIAGAILLANDGGKVNTGLRPLDMAHRDFDRALTSWVNAEVIEHLVRVIMDKLHIHRLRQLWKELEASLPLARSERVTRNTPKIPPPAVTAPSNGGSRERHSHEMAAQAKTPYREAKELDGD